MVEALTKIKVDNPVVDMDGDEMTRIIWKWIKDKVRYCNNKLRGRKIKSLNHVFLQLASLLKHHLIIFNS